jgi:hypothetical protein
MVYQRDCTWTALCPTSHPSPYIDAFAVHPCSNPAWSRLLIIPTGALWLPADLHRMEPSASSLNLKRPHLTLNLLSHFHLYFAVNPQSQRFAHRLNHPPHFLTFLFPLIAGCKLLARSLSLSSFSCSLLSIFSLFSLSFSNSLSVSPFLRSSLV